MQSVRSPRSTSTRAAMCDAAPGVAYEVPHRSNWNRPDLAVWGALLAEEPNSYRQSQAYNQLSPEDADKLEQAHEDMLLLSQVLEIFADREGRPPHRLEELVPQF